MRKEFECQAQNAKGISEVDSAYPPDLVPNSFEERPC